MSADLPRQSPFLALSSPIPAADDYTQVKRQHIVFRCFCFDHKVIVVTRNGWFIFLVRLAARKQGKDIDFVCETDQESLSSASRPNKRRKTQAIEINNQAVETAVELMWLSLKIFVTIACVKARKRLSGSD